MFNLWISFIEAHKVFFLDKEKESNNKTFQL